MYTYGREENLVKVGIITLIYCIEGKGDGIYPSKLLLSSCNISLSFEVVENLYKARNLLI